MTDPDRRQLQAATQLDARVPQAGRGPGDREHGHASGAEPIGPCRRAVPKTPSAAKPTATLPIASLREQIHTERMSASLAA